VSPEIVAVGEVGLAGEVRQVGHLARRLGEAARLGFARALVPHGAAASVSAAGLRIEPIASVVDALRVTGVLGK
jgi:DNA repair protein RadA/Sms